MTCPERNENDAVAVLLRAWNDRLGVEIMVLAASYKNDSKDLIGCHFVVDRIAMLLWNAKRKSDLERPQPDEHEARR